jgi:hypothetical protein
MPQLFMSYRRADSGGHTGRLYDRLAAEFGSDHVIIDVDSIELGLDFAKQIDDFVSSCDALLAIIGPSWLTSKGEDGSARLEDPTTSSGSRSRPHCSAMSESSRCWSATPRCRSPRSCRTTSKLWR